MGSRSLRVCGIAVLTIPFFCNADALAQQAPRATAPFDGKYSGTMRCVGLANSRLNGLIIRQGRFTFTFKTTRGAGSVNCALQVMSDGSFENQSCDLPTRGKVVGDKLEASFKSADAICEISATRERS
jgi:hypothetical protein